MGAAFVVLSFRASKFRPVVTWSKYLLTTLLERVYLVGSFFGNFHYRLMNFVSFCVNSLNIVSSKSDVHKVKEYQNSFIGARKKKMLVHRVGDLSSSKKYFVCWGFLPFRINILLEVEVFQDFLQCPCDLGVQHLDVGRLVHWNRVGRSQVVDILSNLDPRHRIRWMARNRTNFLFQKFNCPKLIVEDVGNFSNFYVSFSYERNTRQ